MLKWKVESRQRLVAFLQEKVGGSGKGIRRSLERNSCRVNGRVERFGSSWVDKGNVVEYFSAEHQNSPFAILLETPDLLIVDKPDQWICDEAHCKKTFGPDVFLVHRLDKDTTGALLLAKSLAVRDELMQLFADRTVEKEYLALADGVPRETDGVRETYLARKGAFEGQTIWGSSPRGDLAITPWAVLSRGDQASLIRCLPLTGRTHQIRVHLAELGHPILVDRQYAAHFRSPLFAARPLLHASRLKFPFRGGAIEASAPIPADFREALASVGIIHKQPEASVFCCVGQPLNLRPASTPKTMRLRGPRPASLNLVAVFNDEKLE